MSYTTLADLKLGETATIQKLYLTGNFRRRLLDLGFSPGISVTPLFRSPLGDPTAYLVLDSIIALRQRDARLIAIQKNAQEG